MTKKDTVNEFLQTEGLYKTPENDVINFFHIMGNDILLYRDFDTARKLILQPSSNRFF